MKKKVLVGLSGGVDSAVAAYLLIQEGYEVSACFMRNWDAMANNDYLGNPTIDDPQCPQEKDYDDAKKVAESLNIPLYRIDFIKEYWDEVFSYFIKEYENGRTPNPDIFCNKYIKFDAFLNYALEHEFDLIAMGHYAKKETINGEVRLLKSFDQNKDQTYFLSQISQTQLAMCLFPLGDIDKNEVRRIAHRLNLNVADKKDSTGVCFIGERNFRQFLKNYIPAQKGDIVDINTHKVIGTHDGVMYYTIGQRKGLGIGGIKDIKSSGWFVCKKDTLKNVLYVSNGDEDRHLYSNRCIVKMMNWIGSIPDERKTFNVKFRYRQKDHPTKYTRIDNETIELRYDSYKAVTVGQAAVLYDGDVCLGGGIINKVYFNEKRIDN